MLKTRAKGKAAGSQGIAYEWIAHLGEREKGNLVEIMNACLIKEDTPIKWKRALISPIPKGKEEEGVLSKLRPIALLEAPRKLFTKILKDRMTEILTEKKILSELNWAGLSGESTREPISLLSSCMEHAKDTRK